MKNALVAIGFWLWIVISGLSIVATCGGVYLLIHFRTKLAAWWLSLVDDMQGRLGDNYQNP